MSDRTDDVGITVPADEGRVERFLNSGWTMIGGGVVVAVVIAGIVYGMYKMVDSVLSKRALEDNQYRK
jgi:hypothetical protein